MSKQKKWQDKLSDFFGTCQDEFKKTTLIGRKMLSATKTTTSLRDDYEELGQLVLRELKTGALKWDHPRVKQLVEHITQLETDLTLIEKEVQDVKERNSTRSN